MGNFNPRKFVNPDTLKRVSYENLLALLRSTAGTYLAAAVEPGGPPRCDLTASEAEFDFDALAAVLLTPDDDYPDDLADALYHLDELAGSEGVDRLLEDEELCKKLGVKVVGPDDAPEDIALRAWLVDRNAVERVLGEQFLFRSKSFLAFMGPNLKGKKLAGLTEERLEPLKAQLRGWFDDKKGSDFLRLITYERDDATWFLVRHALAVRRSGVIRDGKPTSALERPDRHDIVVYVHGRDELAINAGSDGERKLYRAAFGQHLFGKADYFAEDGKYQLKPLRSGRESLSTAGVEGLHRVVLREVQVYWGGDDDEVEIRRSNDLFTTYSEDSGRTLPSRLTRARFDLYFTNNGKPSKRPRSLTIRTPNVAKYQQERDKDTVEAWMIARKFIKPRDGASSDGDE